MLAGLIIIVVAVLGQQSAPEPPRSVGSTSAPSESPAPSPSRTPRSSDASEPPVVTPAETVPLGASRPVSIEIPKIGAESTVFPIGLTPTGELAVPQPGPNLDKAAWFEQSPTPGQPGPSIIEGHVDTESGPSVFYRLGELRPGDEVLVRRQDGTRLTFTVHGVRNVSKSTFPTRLVYGGDDLTTPQLRQITCSDFDPTVGHHLGNQIIFTHLTKVRR